MGIITTTGLAGVLSKVFIKYSTTHTLPFFTYLTSMIITLFVPSGGGHWAVQGPFAVPAAVQLHSSLAGTTMAVAMGESVANMLQPFWALPDSGRLPVHRNAPCHGLHGRHPLYLGNRLRPLVALPDPPAVNPIPRKSVMRSRSGMVFGLLSFALAMALNLRASEPSFKLQNTWKLGEMEAGTTWLSIPHRTSSNAPAKPDYAGRCAVRQTGQRDYWSHPRARHRLRRPGERLGISRRRRRHDSRL